MKKDKKLKIGQRFGRPDIERCDIFLDFGFLNWGKFPEKPIVLNEECKKGLQMYSSVPDGGHKKSGMPANSGYFDPVFRSIFINDPYVEKWKFSGRPTPHPRKGPWIPSHPASKHSTPGDNYGTFTKKGDYEAFDPATIPEKEKPKEPRNFITNPGKKGSSGYVNICINKYPPHSVSGKVDFYYAAPAMCSLNWKTHKGKILNGPLKTGFYPRCFDEQPYKATSVGPTYVQRPEKEYGKSRGIFIPSGFPKLSGITHTGCLNKFPEWTPEPYMTAQEALNKLGTPERSDLVFRPEPRIKSYYTTSIVNNKVDIACNERTWKAMKPITYPQFNL